MSPNGYDVSAGGTQPFFRQGQILSLLPSLPPSVPYPFPPSNFRPGPGPSRPSLHPSVHHSSPTTFFPRSPWVLTHRTKDSGYRVTYCGLGWWTVLVTGVCLRGVFGVREAPGGPGKATPRLILGTSIGKLAPISLSVSCHFGRQTVRSVLLQPWPDSKVRDCSESAPR